MREWIEIDPESRTVEIYLPNGRVEILSNPESLKGEALLQGFALDLLPVWDPLNH